MLTLVKCEVLALVMPRFPGIVLSWNNRYRNFYSGFMGSTTLEDIYFGCATNHKMKSHMPFPGIVGLDSHDIYFGCGTLVVVFRNGWIHFGSAFQLFGRSTPLLADPIDNFYHLSFQGISVEDEDIKLSKKSF